MIELTWTNVALIFGAGYFVVGKKDLPLAARFCGRQVGRMVGLIQGARVKATRLAEQQSSAELKELQAELRSGLRELDMVRAEMTHTFRRPGGGTAASPMALQPRVNARELQDQQQQQHNPPDMAPSRSNISDNSMTPPPTTAPPSSASPTTQHLAPSSHAMGAYVEDEWAKQGIDFKSRAEQGQGIQKQQAYDPSTAGSTILSNMMQSSLLMDQYDRAYHQALEQEEQVRQRIQERERQRQQRDAPNSDASSSSSSGPDKSSSTRS
mmetsp:Transcript_12088/g.33447  ORF Transcript_12088/g.33447 Transcript_12088/m.33447 type:complete len:267 (-) Transcript_12088:2221-3021(-)